MMITGTPARFCKTALTDTAAVVYSAKSDGRSVIMDICATNTTANQQHVYIYVGGSATSDALIFKAPIAAESYININRMFQIVNQNESIYAKTLNNGAVTLTISGLERV